MFKISVMELVICLSEVIDMMSETIHDHHKRVACAAYQLANACEITGEAKRNLVIAAALHDIGCLSLEARTSATMNFEDTSSHAEQGYRLLSMFKPFSDIASIIRYHHTKWEHGKGFENINSSNSLFSQIIFMADRISVALPAGVKALTRAKKITKRVIEQKHNIYKPELVEAFQGLAFRDAFWLNIMSQNFYESIMEELKVYDIILSGTHLEEMLNLISSIIDFRRSFTAMHSKGVASVAEKLAELMGFSQKECFTMRVAAFFHDIGKLAIPPEIIDKPGPLTIYERDIIRTHSYYTDRVLTKLSGFDDVRRWASLHHESINGNGYPHGFKNNEICLGARILRVADIFVALMENRPYRQGMSLENALAILKNMVKQNEIAKNVVETLQNNIHEIEKLRYETWLKVEQQYKKFSNLSSIWLEPV